MEPEIDRRCPECGAAVRARSAFCPQCGRPMKAGGAAATTTTSSPLAETQESVPLSETLKDDDNKEAGNSSTRPLNVTAPSINASELTATQASELSSPPPSPAPRPEPLSVPAQVAREQIASGRAVESLPEARTRGRRGQRVVGAARDVVEERLGPRVEKLKQASNVVWGEAQDDPNLRFILVAVFLFILAMVIILLGTFLR